VKEPASGGLPPVLTAAFATMSHQAWVARPDRRELSDVRSSLLSNEPAPAIFTAMQGDHVS
jgi:hypothetical protein